MIPSFRPLLGALVALACITGTGAGCSSSHVVGDTIALGYHVGDSCTSLSTQATCTASASCQWLALPSGDGGVCYTPDPCLTRATQKECAATSGCQWSRISALCPAGASCKDGGYCHADSGTCSCVTPIACAAGKACATPECDCDGGGTGSGGTCTCNAPDCAPGQSCPPTTCDCVGTGTGTGCVGGGTCVCNCPECPAGQACPQCSCGCGSTGAVPAPSPGTITSGVNTTASPNIPASPDPCAAHTDQTSCIDDTSDSCVWLSETLPCPSSVDCNPPPVCERAVATQPGGPCACNCPLCEAGNTTCTPCACDCSGSTPPADGGTTTCTPPTPSNGPIACPAIACATACPNGYVTGSDGCPTCQCK